MYPEIRKSVVDLLAMRRRRRDTSGAAGEQIAKSLRLHLRHAARQSANAIVELRIAEGIAQGAWHRRIRIEFIERHQLSGGGAKIRVRISPRFRDRVD